MKAEDMFKALGYECRKSENAIQYFSECGKEITFIFELHRFYKQLNFISLNIDIDEFKAIHQQMKELGWLEEKTETNYEHFKDEIIEECMWNLAIVKGKPKPCNSVVYCSDCDFYVSKDNENNCNEKFKEWLKKSYEKPKYELSQFEFDLIKTFDRCKECCLLNEIECIKKLREKGYFNGIDPFTKVHDIIDNCEVIQ